MKKRVKQGIGCAVSVWLMLVSFAVYGQSAPMRKPQPGIQVIAHRGASGLAPENTLAAFKKALDLGVNYIELDVHLTQDDSLVVMHDHKLNRTTDGEGEIEDATYAYIARLDAGAWFSPEYTHERVPTLGQVLRLVNGKTKVLIELKWPRSGIYNNLVKRVLQTIRECHAESWVAVQSFETRYLEEMRETAADINCQQLILGKPAGLPVYITRRLHGGRFRPAPGVTSVNVAYLYLNEAFVQRMHRQGLTVYVYTLNDKEKMRDAIHKGADGIITNRPDVLLELLNEKTF